MNRYNLFIATFFLLPISTFAMWPQRPYALVIANAYYHGEFYKCIHYQGYLTCKDEDGFEYCLPTKKVRNIFFENLRFFETLTAQVNEEDDRNYLQWARQNTSKKFEEFMQAMSPYHTLKFAYRRVLAERNSVLEDALKGGCESYVVLACKNKEVYCDIWSNLDMYIGVKTIHALIKEKQAVKNNDN